VKKATKSAECADLKVICIIKQIAIAVTKCIKMKNKCKKAEEILQINL
jgi:hypothetical protein